MEMILELSVALTGNIFKIKSIYIWYFLPKPHYLKPNLGEYKHVFLQNLFLFGQNIANNSMCNFLILKQVRYLPDYNYKFNKIWWSDQEFNANLRYIHTYLHTYILKIDKF